MAKVRINFEDFVEMLEDTEYGFHFENDPRSDNGELLLKLFLDGNPSDYEISIRSDRVEVTKEMEL